MRVFSTKAIGLTIACAFLLSACADTGTVQQRNTATGAAIGAGAGAITGLILGDDKKDVKIGTAGGAIIGGIIGHQKPAY